MKKNRGRIKNFFSKNPLKKLFPNKVEKERKRKSRRKRIRLWFRPPEKMILKYLYRFRFDKEYYKLNQLRFLKAEQNITGLSDMLYIEIDKEQYLHIPDPRGKDKPYVRCYFCRITKLGVERVESGRNNQERRVFAIVNIALAFAVVGLTLFNVISNNRATERYDRLNNQVDEIRKEIKDIRD